MLSLHWSFPKWKGVCGMRQEHPPDIKDVCSSHRQYTANPDNSSPFQKPVPQTRIAKPVHSHRPSPTSITSILSTTRYFPWPLHSTADFLGCILSNVLQGTCWKSLICAKNEDRSCWQKPMGLMQSLNMKTLLSLFSIPWCVEDKSNDWFLQFDPTKQKSWPTFQ